MNTQNINVKTAASESSERWVKTHFNSQLAERTDRLLRLAKLEGTLMMYRALSALGEEAVDDVDLFGDVCFAAQLIIRMTDEGDIATAPAYELALSVQKLAKTLLRQTWETVSGSGLPDLEWLQNTAKSRREAKCLALIENARPFGVTVSGRTEFPEDDPVYGSYWRDDSVELGRADTLQGAMLLLLQARTTGDWKLREDDVDYWDEDTGRDMGPLSFSPAIVTIRDLENRIVLRGDAHTLKWTEQESA